MKKTIFIIAVTCLIIFSFGFERRYASVFWKSTTSGVEFINGDVGITAGDIVFATDVSLQYRTIVKTVDLDDDLSTDDFQFNDDATNSNAQNIDLGALIPAYAEIVSAQVRCFETVGAGTFQIKLGTASGGTEILTQATVDAADEIKATGAFDAPEIGAVNSAVNIWFEGDPSGNWSAAGSAGRWIIIVTYLDNGAAFTLKNP